MIKKIASKIREFLNAEFFYLIENISFAEPLRLAEDCAKTLKKNNSSISFEED